MAASSKPPGTPDRRKTKPRDPLTGRTASFVPTDEQRRIVMAAKMCGMENSGIAKALDIDRDTLAKHFKAELAGGREAVEAKIAGKMVGMALDVQHKDSQRAGQFLLQSQFKWRTRDELVHQFGLGASGDEGQPAEDDVKPAKITVEFVTTRPKGLPGAPPEDR